jgi:hypothetical protein
MSDVETGALLAGVNLKPALCGTTTAYQLLPMLLGRLPRGVSLLAAA